MKNTTFCALLIEIIAICVMHGCRICQNAQNGSISDVLFSILGYIDIYNTWHCIFDSMQLVFALIVRGVHALISMCMI